MRRSFLLLSLIFGTALASFAQPLNKATYETMVATAEESYADQDYVNAIEWYEKAYEERNDNKDLVLMIAKCHYALKDYPKAERAYRRLLRRDKENKYAAARFAYARTLKINESYPDAIEEFQAFIAESTNDSLKTLAQVEITGAEMAMESIGVSKGVSLENAGKTLNGKLSEYSPVLSPDGKTMYFAKIDGDDVQYRDPGSEGTDFSKIYMSEKEEKGWGKPKELSNKINREGFHAGNVALSPDGKTMFFTRAELDGNNLSSSKLFYSTGNGNSWGAANEVNGINGDYIVKNPTVGEFLGKEVIFFSANAPGGKGGFDIFYATKKDEGVYGDPINLGDVINSIGDEETPFYRDGTLYFSSTGLPGLGGYDIFYTTWDGTKWSAPTNMGKGFNTSLDDMYFSMDEEGYNGFLVSNRPGGRSAYGKTCCGDIYEFSIAKLYAELVVGVFDENKKPLKEALVQIEASTGETESQQNKAGNRFDFPLNLEQQYRIVVSREGYFPDSSQSLSTLDLKESQTFEKRVFLKAKPVPPPEPEYETIVTNQPIVLENILYDFDDDRIRESAESDLQVVFEQMEKYEDMVIELGSHTDARGNATYNQDLSQRRAESARRWLVRKGIARDRIEAKGYGKSEPQTVNEASAFKHDFLNEGDVLTQEFIDALETEEAQEIAHELNRRTGFKIISGPTSIRIETKRLKKKEAPKKAESKKKKSRTRSRRNRGSNILPVGVDPKDIHELSSLHGMKNLKGIPVMQFEERTIDFGKVKKGEKRYHTYKFTNIGDTDLVISIVSACDCTIADYSTKPVKPGESGEIDVTFDSTEKDDPETINIDIILENEVPGSGDPIIERIQYDFDIEK